MPKELRFREDARKGLEAAAVKFNAGPNADLSTESVVAARSGARPRPTRIRPRSCQAT